MTKAELEVLVLELEQRLERLSDRIYSVDDLASEAMELANSAHSQVYDLTDRVYGDENLTERVQTALLDISGVNLDQRILAAAERLNERVDGLARELTPGGTHSDVESTETTRLADGGTRDVAWEILPGIVTYPAPDDGAGQSETVSPDRESD